MPELSSYCHGGVRHTFGCKFRNLAEDCQTKFISQRCCEGLRRSGPAGDAADPGWLAQNGTAVRSGPPPTNPNIHIVSDKYAMVERTLSPTKSRVDLDFTHLYGSLDPELHFVPPAAFGPDGGLVKDGLSISLTLVLVDRYLELESGGGSPKETVTAPTWRIEAFQAGVLLDLPAAIRYVTEKREQTTDPAIKKNADATLAILRLLK